ncbi:hypothetical protein GCM10022211_07970 [Sphingomonas humi]|uniref:Uncharacterized protein n=1 Tax=Sphingomonas humi TaxID=335630 RepID=A0ABP7RNV4_9SPHN
MEMTDRRAEALGHFAGDAAGKVDLVRVEVEVNVEVGRRVHAADMGMEVPRRKGQLPFTRVCAYTSPMTGRIASASYYYLHEVGIG